MSTGEGDNPRDGQPRRNGDERRGERIGVGGGDDSVSRIQLAARWAEAYSGDADSLGAVLRRFKVAYDYLDAVIHGVEPPEPDSLADEAKPVAATTASPQWSNPTHPEPPPPAPAPPPPPWSPPPPPPQEPRPW